MWSVGREHKGGQVASRCWKYLLVFEDMKRIFWIFGYGKVC